MWNCKTRRASWLAFNLKVTLPELWHGCLKFHHLQHENYNRIEFIVHGSLIGLTPTCQAVMQYFSNTNTNINTL